MSIFRFHESRARAFLPMLLAATLAAGGLAVQVTPAEASTPCSVWSLSPTTDGNWAYGTSKMDCPSNPISDWLSSELVEWLIPGVYASRDTEVNNANSEYEIQAYTSYYCNGHGTDDWQVRANGRDANGGESGWLWGSANSLTC